MMMVLVMQWCNDGSGSGGIQCDSVMIMVLVIVL